jgi:hypothetical protein
LLISSVQQAEDRANGAAALGRWLPHPNRIDAA